MGIVPEDTRKHSMNKDEVTPEAWFYR